MQNVPKQVTDAAALVERAGGRIIGRTRLQKVAYLLEISGKGTGFSFEYRHYGPYSEALADAIATARSIGLISERENLTSWGGWYSVYESARSGAMQNGIEDPFLRTALSANPVELELAATAAYLAQSGENDPWGETARRKPDKATSIEAAKTLYSQLKTLQVPVALPQI